MYYLFIIYRCVEAYLTFYLHFFYILFPQNTRKRQNVQTIRIIYLISGKLSLETGGLGEIPIANQENLGRGVGKHVSIMLQDQ